MYMYILNVLHIYVYTCTYMQNVHCVYTFYIFTYLYIYTIRRLCVYTHYVYIYTLCIYTCLYIVTFIHVYMHIYICLYMYIYLYIHICIYAVAVTLACRAAQGICGRPPFSPPAGDPRARVVLNNMRVYIYTYIHIYIYIYNIYQIYVCRQTHINRKVNKTTQMVCYLQPALRTCWLALLVSQCLLAGLCGQQPAYVHIHVYMLRTHQPAYIYIYIHMYPHKKNQKKIYMFIYIYICIYKQIYICIYTYEYPQKSKETHQMLSVMLFAASPVGLLAGLTGQPLLAGWPFLPLAGICAYTCIYVVYTPASIYVHVCTYVYIFVYMHIHIYIYVYLYIHNVYNHAYIYVYRHIRKYIGRKANKTNQMLSAMLFVVATSCWLAFLANSVHMCICMHIYVYIYVYIYIYIYMYIQQPSFQGCLQRTSQTASDLFS